MEESEEAERKGDPFNRSPVVQDIFEHYASRNTVDSTAKHVDCIKRNKKRSIVIYKFAQSVVSVSSFYGVERRMDCSGLIIEWNSTLNEASILTTAELLRRVKDASFVKQEFNIIVRLGNGRLLCGAQDYVDYYHNLLIIKVKSTETLNAVDLSSNQATDGLIEGMNVVALGREFNTCSFSDDVGELFCEYPNFGCELLWRSTCCISAASGGGPLITEDGFVVGITCFDDIDYGHPLPIQYILASLEMRKSFGTVMRPWFGLCVVDVDQLPYYVWERFNISPNDSCVVKKVYEGSPAYINGVRPGDFVASCDGTSIQSSKQYFQILLDRSRTITAGGDSDSLRQSFTVVIQPSDRRASKISVEAENVAVNDKRFRQCWPIVGDWYTLKCGSQRDPVLPGVEWKVSPSFSTRSYPAHTERKGDPFNRSPVVQGESRKRTLDMVSHSKAVYFGDSMFTRLDCEKRNKLPRNVFSKFAQSLVSVSSFYGVERRMDCSGLIIEWSSTLNEASILTTARLLRCPKNASFAKKKFNIIVRLANGRLLCGTQDYVDYYHNLLIIKVESTETLNAVDLSLNQATDGLIEGMNVVALGREFYTCSFKDDVGELYCEYPNFGCELLWRSTCCISAASEGGPLVTEDGFVVGVNFFDDKNSGHLLPIQYILANLEMWKSFGTVLRPWFGLCMVDVYQLPYYLWERFNISSDDSCVVKKVYEGSPAYINGVRPGDLVTSCDGTSIQSIKQYFQILLDRSRTITAGGDSDSLSQSFTVVIQPSDRRASKISVEAENVAVNDKRFCQCWPTVGDWYTLKCGSQCEPVIPVRVPRVEWKPSPVFSMSSNPPPPWFPSRS